MSQKILFQLTRRLSKTVKKYYSRPIVERTEWGYRIFQMHNSTGCPKKNYTHLWHRINQAHNIGPKCNWYHFLQNIFLHMLVKFQRIIMNTFLRYCFLSTHVRSSIYVTVEIRERYPKMLVSYLTKLWIFYSLDKTIIHADVINSTK